MGTWGELKRSKEEVIAEKTKAKERGGKSRDKRDENVISLAYDPIIWIFGWNLLSVTNLLGFGI